MKEYLEKKTGEAEAIRVSQATFMRIIRVQTSGEEVMTGNIEQNICIHSKRKRT